MRGEERRRSGARRLAGVARARAGGLLAVAAPALAPGSQDDIPTDKPKLRAFCTDRPGQGTLPCTVDPGHLQLEADLFNVAYDRGQGRETYLFTNPTLKLGVAPRADLELQVAPYEQVHRLGSSAGLSRDLYGVGDVTVRYKQNFFGDYRGPLAAALEPFVTAPTGRRGIGDAGWEGGLMAPFALGLSKSLVLNFAPEVDVRRDQVGAGVHTEEFVVANVTVQLPKRLGLLLEVATRNSQDADAHTQVFCDFALSLSLVNDAEVDVGINHALNPFAPANQLYVGLAKRF